MISKEVLAVEKFSKSGNQAGYDVSTQYILRLCVLNISNCITIGVYGMKQIHLWFAELTQAGTQSQWSTTSDEEATEQQETAS